MSNRPENFFGFFFAQIYLIKTKLFSWLHLVKQSYSYIVTLLKKITKKNPNCINVKGKVLLLNIISKFWLLAADVAIKVYVHVSKIRQVNSS